MKTELNDVEKAARKSMLSHFGDLKKAASDHAAAANAHMQAVHGMVNKVMKLAGFDGDPEHEGGQKGVTVPETAGSAVAIKSGDASFVLIGKTADGVEVFKKVEAAAGEVTKTPEQIAAKAEKKAAKQAFRDAIIKIATNLDVAKAATATDPAKVVTVVGDRKDVVNTGKVEKTTAERKAEEDALLTVAKAAFAGDPKALNELYDKTVTRTAIGRPSA